jgi:predicted small lipoprotein YifL
MTTAHFSLAHKFLALAVILALSGCGENPAQTGPGGLPPDDARLLEEAARKLDAKALPPPTLEQIAPLQNAPAQTATAKQTGAAKQAEQAKKGAPARAETRAVTAPPQSAPSQSAGPQ